MLTLDVDGRLLSETRSDPFDQREKELINTQSDIKSWEDLNTKVLMILV